MAEQMWAAVLTEPGKIEVQRVPKPEPGPGEALIRVSCCGVCGSDIGMAYGHAHTYPLILGHEFSGVVECAGSPEDGGLVGTAVTAAPLLACNRCPSCLAGQPQLCGNYVFLGSGINGAMAEYVKVPVKNLLPLENLTMEQGALIEPLTIALHGVSRVSRDTLRHTVVSGAGPIGLLTALAAKAMGAEHVLVLDVDDEKISFARSLGMDAVNSLDRDSLLGRAAGATAVFECAAVQASLRTALELAGARGTVVLIGIPKRDTVLRPEDMRFILRKELTVTGAWLSRHMPHLPDDDWRTARQLIETGYIPADVLITSRGKLKDAPHILEEIYRNPGREIKTMIRCEGSL